MFHALQVLAILLVALATALAVAHALEMPGKLRLSKDAYLTTQTIYYPGFTFGGICEPLGVIVLLILTVLTPGGAAFWLTLGALIALAAMHAVYWAATHPVNNFWLKDFHLKGATGAFFLFDPLKRTSPSGTPEWTALRDQWEYSHVLRAGLGLVSLVLLATAVAV
jgi:hypothetical protein